MLSANGGNGGNGGNGSRYNDDVSSYEEQSDRKNIVYHKHYALYKHFPARDSDEEEGYQIQTADDGNEGNPLQSAFDDDDSPSVGARAGFGAGVRAGKFST